MAGIQKTTRRCFLKAVALASSIGLSGYLSGTGNSCRKEKKPNIFVILTDDLGWADVSTYNQATLYETPNIQRSPYTAKIIVLELKEHWL